MKNLLDKLIKKNLSEAKLGTVANYIPELDKAKKNALGVYIIDNGEKNIFLEITIQSLLFKAYQK